MNKTCRTFFAVIFIGSTNLLVWKFVQEGGKPDLVTIPVVRCNNCSFNTIMKNQDISSFDNHSMVVLIHSSIDHWEYRNKIRNFIRRLTFNWKFIFVLGMSQNVNIEKRIQIESRSNRDIIQGQFIDSYRNLTIKHLFGLKWAVEHFPKVAFIMKIDDDIFINYYLLNKFINNLLSRQEGYYVVGYVHNKMKTIRDPKSKWFVTELEFPFAQYPQFCSGWAYLGTVEAIKMILCNKKNFSKNFWIDDVYVTGILRNECFKLKPINHLYNIDPLSLKHWIDNQGKLQWHFLFSNTDNVHMLSNALKLNAIIHTNKQLYR